MLLKLLGDSLKFKKNTIFTKIILLFGREREGSEERGWREGERERGQEERLKQYYFKIRKTNTTL